VRMAKQIMPSKGMPFPIEDWSSVVLEGLRVANENNWFPMMTLMVGNPGETDEDVRETLDLVYEMERRGVFAFLVPSIFTPLHDTRMQHQTGVTHTRQLRPLQWQLILKCWKMNLRPGQYSWWGPMAWRMGAIFMWLYRLRRLNGPNFTWPLLMFSGVAPERALARMGRAYIGRPLETKSRRELIDNVRPNFRRYFRADNGDLPEDFIDSAPPGPSGAALHPDSLRVLG
jgi:hypothetical protein